MLRFRVPSRCFIESNSFFVVQELKEACKSMGLSIKGNKPDLIQRLEEAIAAEDAEAAPAAEEVADTVTETAVEEPKVPSEILE